MNPSPAPAGNRPSAKHRWLWGLTVVLLLLSVATVFGITSYFRFSTDTIALRDGLMKSSGVEWRQRIGINVGGLTMCAVRTGLSFVHLDPQARAALQSVRGVQIGIYQLPPGVKPPDHAAMLTAADHAVVNRGWNRVVCVLNHKDLVTVYLQDRTTWMRRVKCFVLVFDGRQMVMVAAQGNPEPLIECLLSQPDVGANLKLLAKR